MTHIAEQTAEVVAENVEELIDGVVDVVEIVRNNPVVLAIVGVAGLVAGGVGGYFFAQKKLRDQFEQLATEEIADAKQFYAGLYKVDPNGVALSPKDIMVERHGAEAAEAFRDYAGMDEGTIEGVPEGEPYDDVADEAQIKKLEDVAIRSISIDKEPGPGGGKIVSVEKKVEHNIFVDDSFDLEEESKHRTPERPYIITHDEFYNSDKDHDTASLVYYEVDDTLCDERDDPMTDIDKKVGDDHLVRFGSGSRDQNVVYVRNERLSMDYEITRSKGSYLEEVLSLTAEDPGTLKHSDQRNARRALRHGDG